MVPLSINTRGGLPSSYPMEQHNTCVQELLVENSGKAFSVCLFFSLSVFHIKLETHNQDKYGDDKFVHSASTGSVLS
ncbi:hypothetical protein M8J76_014544 [Diaphorina citri]|nr:hypothetical protein M8J76_014544 [Diaphorina citri]